MKIERINWSRRYRTALGRYVKSGAAANLKPAQQLGNQAVSMKLDPLDLALIHEEVLAPLATPKGASTARSGMRKRSDRFFAETVVPIEKTHHAALKNNRSVKTLTQSLRRRSADADQASRRLKHGIARRRTAEATLKKSEKHRQSLIKKSSRLRNQLQDQVSRIMSVQEKKRSKDSRQLQDEIAQTLLAINIRLLALKNSARIGTEKLEKEIAETQELVRQSVRMIQKAAHEFGEQR